jgi:hypothetical protein
MPVKYIVSIIAAALIGYSISNSYSQEVIFCDGFECAEGAPALEARIAALEALLADVTRGTDPNTGQDTLTFSAMNVQVVSGSGTTGGEVNGTGNLIIGYNDLRGDVDDRTGSHMLVTGIYNNYSSYGGIVVGEWHGIWGEYASISGGSGHTVSGYAASVSGGQGNTASGHLASVSGGKENTASGEHSSVSGGAGNTASGLFTSVSGGAANNPSGEYASVSGGADNVVTGDTASISGGQGNTATANWASVSGGIAKTADVAYCTTAGNIGSDCAP